MNIDLVYAWVDGADPVWRAKKAAYNAEVTELSAEATCEGRYVNSDELKYSLRSVEMFAPWINHIYIITDDQTPEWLDTSNPKISIVSHRDILPAEVLPTFNSNVIESGIANIEGLSEHFLLANDDMMFGRKVSPSDFFTEDGKAIIRLTKRSIIAAQKFYAVRTPYRRTLMLANSLIFEDFGVHYSQYTPSHQIDSYIKSSYEECIELYKEKIEESRTHKFRQSDDIVRHLYTLYTLEKQNGVMRVLPKWPGKFKRALIKSKLSDGIENFYSSISSSVLEKRIKSMRPLLFCANDSEKCTDAHRVRFKEIMGRMYPKKSSFEL